MFAIYTPQGRAFSGTLEKLRKVEKNAATGATRVLAEDTLERQTLLPGQSLSPSKRALEQYQQLVNRDKSKEPVYHAYQVMSLQVESINSHWSLAKAYQHFKQYSYELFPVVNDSNQLLGTLARKDFYAFIIHSNSDISRDFRTIEQCFLQHQQAVYTAEPITDIRRIASLMLEKQLAAIAIVEQAGRIVGIVSRTDILRCTTSDPPLSLWC